MNNLRFFLSTSSPLIVAVVFWSVPTAPVNCGSRRLSPGHRTTRSSFSPFYPFDHPYVYFAISFHTEVIFFFLRLLLKVGLEDDGESRLAS